MGRNEAAMKARLYDEVQCIPLAESHLCANCDTIHNSDECPLCTSRHSLSLLSILKSTRTV